MNRHKRYYISRNLLIMNPLKSFMEAIDNYIQSREKWLDSCCGCIGWRGGLRGLKLFFNPSKTKKNIMIMDAVHEKARDAIKAKNLNILSHFVKSNMNGMSNGRGKKLLNLFLQTTKKDDYLGIYSFLPSKLVKEVDKNYKKDMVIGNNYKFIHDRYLASGAYGSANSFKPVGALNTDNTNNLVIKVFNPGMQSSQEFEHECIMFDEALQILRDDIDDKRYDFAPTHFGVGDQHCAIMPRLYGMPLATYIDQNANDYIEQTLFSSLFSRLWKLHNKTHITHHDLHRKNIFVLDAFQNVFFLDFGLAKRHSNMYTEEAAKGMECDLAYAFYGLMRTRYKIGDNSCRLTIGKVKNDFPAFNNWFDFYDHINLDNIIRQANNMLQSTKYRNQYYRIRKK
ncbi:MAG: hypothetical protein GY718_04875 [Lentisphaerae bacterium]|nr:hypothetical protein [Lentisphaerota bacterium]